MWVLQSTPCERSGGCETHFPLVNCVELDFYSGLGFERENEGWNSALQVLQLESLEFGLLCNSEKLLWHQDIGGVKVWFYKNTRDWLSKYILDICVGKLPMKRSQHGPNV